jgi:hypothetical protein
VSFVVHEILHDILTVEPAATVAVAVLAPLAPPTLQRMLLEVTSVTGELLGTGRMFAKAAPVTPFAMNLLKISAQNTSA